MIILIAIAKVLMGLFVIALVLAFITAIFLLGAIVATLGTATQPLFGRDQEDNEPEMVNHPDHYNRPVRKSASSRWRRSSGRNMCSIFAC